MKSSKFGLLRSLALISLVLIAFPWQSDKAQSPQKPELITWDQWMKSQAPVTDTPAADPFVDGYVIVKSEDGTSCRLMTREEALKMKVAGIREGLRVINNDADGRGLRLEAQTGLKITLRATSQLDNFPQAKEAFIRAAAVWEGIIQSPITVVIDVDFGPTRFGSPYSSSNVIGSTTNQTLGASNLYTGVRDQLIATSNNAQQTTVFNALPLSNLPTDSGTTTSVFASSPILRALGFIDPVADPSREGQYGAPPSIGFNSNFGFDFDPSDGIAINTIDFNYTAVHEIGHVLGFSSFVGNRELTPTSSVTASPWDFYRFRPGVTLGSFTASSRLLISGGEHTHFSGGDELQLSTSRLDGQGGDGRQAPHWKDDAQTGINIGIMDPTATDGNREDVSPNDLLALRSFGYQLKNSVKVTEVLSADDGSRTVSPVATGALVVNRLTPSRYPAKVTSISVNLPFVSGQPSPAGAPLRLVVFNDPNRTGLPPNNPTLLFDRTFIVPNITSSRFVEFTFDGPTINAGDIYIGVQSTTTPMGIAVDTNGPAYQRSFISQNNGGSFQPLNTITDGSTASNFMARADVSVPFDAVPIPGLISASPNKIKPGGAGLTLWVRGTSFQPNSVVKWNGTDRPTTYLNGSLMQAAISSSDIASAGNATVTIFTAGQGGGDSNNLTVSITADNPAPSIVKIDPSVGAQGISGATVNVFGNDFTNSSVVRWNGSDKPTNFISSVQLSITLGASDLAAFAENKIIVFTPGPGGGTSNEVTFSVIQCSYFLSVTSQSFSSNGGTSGFNLTANSACPWNAVSDAQWITITNPFGASGSGKYVVNYRVLSNSQAGLRTGKITIGNASLNISQAGLVTTVSSANYGLPVSPESIASAFGADLALGVFNSDVTPLPTNLNGTSVRVTDANLNNRSSPLFYVSPSQVNFQVPAGTASGTATVTVFVNGTTVASGSLQVQSVSPSLFSANSSGKDVAAAYVLRIKPDGSQSTEPVAVYNQAQSRFVDKPIDFGPETDNIVLVIFATGVRGRTSVNNVKALLSGQELPVDFAGPQGSFVGLDQINIPIPRTFKGKGEVSMILRVDSRDSNTVTVNFQ